MVLLSQELDEILLLCRKLASKTFGIPVFKLNPVDEGRGSAFREQDGFISAQQTLPPANLYIRGVQLL